MQFNCSPTAASVKQQKFIFNDPSTTCQLLQRMLYFRHNQIKFNISQRWPLFVCFSPFHNLMTTIVSI